ncbi:MAG: peptidylprolyl isomerase [Candidatus Omnitrophota bacterium]
MNTRKLFVMLLVIAIGALFGCGDAKSRILAKVDGKAITVRDFENRLAKLPPYYSSLANKRKKDFLEDMIAEQLLYKEAIRRGLSRMMEVRELIDEAERKILVAKFMEVETNKKAAVALSDIKTFYEANKENFVTPLRLRASYILLDTESEAQDALQKIKAGSDFGEVASRYSKDSSKDRGGDIGYFEKGQLAPEIEGVCFNLEAGQVSDVIKTRFGYHIIKLTDRKEPRAIELAEVRDVIEKQLRDNAQQEVLSNLVKRLKAKAKIKINDKLLGGESE